MGAELATRLGNIIAMEAHRERAIRPRALGNSTRCKKRVFPLPGRSVALRQGHKFEVQRRRRKTTMRLCAGKRTVVSELPRHCSGISLGSHAGDPAMVPKSPLLHKWASNANDDDRRRAVLRYIFVGRQSEGLADTMKNDPPVWLPQPIALLQSDALLADWSEKDKKRLLIALGGHDLFVFTPDGATAPPSEAAPGQVLGAIYEWWLANRGDRTGRICRKRLSGVLFANTATGH